MGTLRKIVRLIKFCMLVTLATLATFGGLQAKGWLEPPIEYVEVSPGEKPISQIIRDVAHEHGVSPLLVEAIIRHESRYDAEALRFEAHHEKHAAKHAKTPEQRRMYASSVGLMQVMAWHAPRYGLTWSDLLNPETNIRVGTDILAQCQKKFGSGNVSKLKQVLGCYNGDPNKYPPKVFEALGEIVAERL